MKAVALNWKKLLFFGALILFVGVLVVLGLWISQSAPEEQINFTGETYIVRGDSLAGVVEEGDEVHLVHEEKKAGSMVLYNYAGNENLLIKRVVAAPGDNFSLRQEGDAYYLYVNGKPAKTTEGEQYHFTGKAYEMLANYERSYGKAIPEGAYLILGNIPTGSLDSSRYGLVSEQDIEGVVRKLEE